MNGYTQTGLGLRFRFAAWLGLLELQQVAGVNQLVDRAFAE